MKRKILTKALGLYFNLLAEVFPNKAQKDGLRLFFTPMGSKMKPHHYGFLNSAKLKSIEVDNNKVQIYSWGNGSKKALLVHGWASHSFRWKNYIERLIENDFTVYAIDAPAHGQSEGQYLNVVLYKNAIEAFLKQHPDVEAIISHSFGSFAAIYAVYTQSASHLKKLVTLASPGKVSDFFEFWQKELDLSAKTMHLISIEFEKRLGHKIEFFETDKLAKNFKISGLIIHDKEDKETLAESSEKLHRAWNGSKLIITENLGHELKSDALLTEIITFLK